MKLPIFLKTLLIVLLSSLLFSGCAGSMKILRTPGDLKTMQVNESMTINSADFYEHNISSDTAKVKIFSHGGLSGLSAVRDTLIGFLIIVVIAAAAL